MDEIWIDITGYEGYYQVSNLGRVRSTERIYTDALGRNVKRKSYIIKQEITNCGYLRVHLYKNNNSKHLSVHRLVANAFLPNPDNLPIINHKDENKLNNNVSNLEWCDAKYNINYGTARKRRSEIQINDAKKSKQVAVYKYPTMELIGIFPSRREVERKFNVNNVSKVIKGIYKQEKGYTFRNV